MSNEAAHLAEAALEASGAARGRRWPRALHRIALLLVLALAAFLVARAGWLTQTPRPGSGARFAQARSFLLALEGFLFAATLTALARETRAWIRGDEPVAMLATWRMLFYLLVFSTLAFVTFLQPFWTYYVELAAGSTAGAFGLMVALGPALARCLPRPLIRGLDIAAMNVCLVLVGLELGLRGLARVRPSALFTRPGPLVESQLARYRFEPGEIVGSFACDERGWFDERPQPRRPGDVLVCSIADSFAMGATHQAYHFTTVCEQDLRWCQVYNMGAPCIGPREYAFLLEMEALREDPDAILVCIYLGNDMADAFGNARAEHPWRTLFDRDQMLVYQVMRRLPRALRERGLRDMVDPTHNLRTAPGPRRRRNGIPPPLDPFEEVASMTEETYVEVVGSRVAQSCTGRTYFYEPLFEQLRRMRRACGEIPMYVLVLPDEFQVEDEVWDAARAGQQGELERLESHRVVTAWLEREGLPYLDSLPVLNAVEPLSDGRKHVYHLRNTHFNQRGNEAVGHALAAFLEAQLLPLRRAKLAAAKASWASTPR